MKTMSKDHIFMLLAAAFCVMSAAPALALDPICQQMKSASAILQTKPFHMYMTETQTISGANMAKAASAMGMGGTKQSEEISTAKGIYVLTRGKWIDMQTSFADMEKDKDSDPDTQKSKCKVLPDEVVFGQPATVYSESNPALGIESRIWISKSSHLPIKSEVANDQDTLKIVSTSRYDYTNVQAPAGAMTMKDMMKSHH